METILVARQARQGSAPNTKSVTTRACRGAAGGRERAEGPVPISIGPVSIALERPRVSFPVASGQHMAESVQRQQIGAQSVARRRWAGAARCENPACARVSVQGRGRSREPRCNRSYLPKTPRGMMQEAASRVSFAATKGYQKQGQLGACDTRRRGETPRTGCRATLQRSGPTCAHWTTVPTSCSTWEPRRLAPRRLTVSGETVAKPQLPVEYIR